MQVYRSSILPLIAFIFTLMGITYSACHESKAKDQSSPSGATELRQEVTRFEQDLTDLKTIHDQHIKAYSDEMGTMRDSKALEVINKHKALLEHHTSRLDYHKLQLVQADTTNAGRNKAELEELKKDMQQLTNDAQVIRTGLDDFSPPTHVTK
jgi:hypothetical protein